jgi:hypothetical protein
MQNARFILRHGLEFAVIVLINLGMMQVIRSQWLSSAAACWCIAALALAKTIFFFAEDVQQLLAATSKNAPYHRFMGLMMLNMSQIALSFALDYWCLYTALPASFAGINPDFNSFELVFECCYLSFLNITYFGYGDITPQTIPAKLVTMMELLIAFFTLIFLLSDFISLKDAIREQK